jgi:hypothetical protein
MIDIDWDARPRKHAVLELFSMVMWCGARNARGLLHSGLKEQEDGRIKGELWRIRE